MPARRGASVQYRHIPRMRALISSFGPRLAVRAAVSAVTTGHVVRSNRPSSFSGMKRVLKHVGPKNERGNMPDPIAPFLAQFPEPIRLRSPLWWRRAVYVGQTRIEACFPGLRLRIYGSRVTLHS